MSARPSRVRLRAYKVGFGDCLLLTVTYGSTLADGRRERHMLIDCGSMERADEGPRLADVAAYIEEHSGGQLDVVVATHRHKDHIGGFGIQRVREILDRLQPRVVIRPWTDVPQDQRGDEAFGLDPRHMTFLDTLDKLDSQATSVQLLPFDSEHLAKRAAAIASLGFKNVEAVALLEDWGRRGRAEYVRAGSSLDLTAELPGVSVRVLGPPTLDQVPSLSRYAKESEEYWLALAADGSLTSLVAEAEPDSLIQAKRILAEPGGVGAAEWLLRALATREVSQGLDIVEALDDVLNNTSVILLLTVGSRRLLLPGDAQAENWSLCLDQAVGANGRRRDSKLAADLAKIDLYKVGHHGSRNASPKRLTAHWSHRKGTDHPLVSVLSTKKGVYEKSVEGKVPRDELITGLSSYGPVYSTDDLALDVWWMDLEAPARGRATFTHTPGPAVVPRAQN
jgi:hypothetical protein